MNNKNEYDKFQWIFIYWHDIYIYTYSVIKINKLIFEGNNIIVILKKRFTYVYNNRSRMNFKTSCIHLQ